MFRGLGRHSGAVLILAHLLAGAWAIAQPMEPDGAALMKAGRFAEAIAYFEAQLRDGGFTAAEASSLIGNLGLAHFHQGRHLAEIGDRESARPHFERAADFFWAAKESAAFPALSAVAEFHRAAAHFAAGQDAEAIEAGESFLAASPEAAVAAGLISEEAVGYVREILAASYMKLAESRPESAESLRRLGLAHARAAIEDWPAIVVQPHWIFGRHAFESGDAASARAHLQIYIARMDAIPARLWSEWDRDDYAQAQAILDRL